MKIEPMMNIDRLDQRSAVETLESRVVQASGNVPDINGSKRPGSDPEFDELYRKLLAMKGQGEKAIFLFLKAQLNPDGTLAYPNPKAIMEITHKVVLRLEDEQLDKSLIYKEIKGANARAFGVAISISSFMRDVFQPMGDDSWEKSEW